MQISRSKQLVRVREWALRQLEQLSILLTAVVTADSKTTLDEMRKLSAFLIYRQVYLQALRCLTTVVTNQALISFYVQPTMRDGERKLSELSSGSVCQLWLFERRRQTCQAKGGKLTAWAVISARKKKRFNALRYVRIRDVLCSLSFIFLH